MQEFNNIKEEAKMDLVGALAPNGKFVNEAARITIDAFAKDTYDNLYVYSESAIMAKAQTAIKKSMTDKTPLDLKTVVDNILYDLQRTNPDATEEDAIKLFEEAQKGIE